MLNPNATNVVECPSCGWKRLVDHSRTYRGGHTSPTAQSDCHEQLAYSRASVLPPEMYLLGEVRPKAPQGDIDTLAFSEDPDDNALAVMEAARNVSLNAQITALYELEDEDVDAALTAAAAS